MTIPAKEVVFLPMRVRPSVCLSVSRIMINKLSTNFNEFLKGRDT